MKLPSEESLTPDLQRCIADYSTGRQEEETQMSIKIYKHDHVFPKWTGTYKTTITVEDADTLGAAQRFDNPACLNFASHKRPGGGYKAVQHVPMPIKTQEEDLFPQVEPARHDGQPACSATLPPSGLEGPVLPGRVDRA
jgi:hypothetical protein